MKTCPHCGATQNGSGFGFTIIFECATGLNLKGRVIQSSICKEVCYLRRWKSIVLSNAMLHFPDWGNPHWVVSVGVSDEVKKKRQWSEHQELIDDDFDEAVQAEMIK